MSASRWLKACALFALAFWCALAEAAFEVPRFTSLVVDTATILSPAEQRELHVKLTRVQQLGGPQMAFLSVRSLDDYPIEQATIETVSKWKLGTAARDDGLLLFISFDDRKIRIEVGQGLEGAIPDLAAYRIHEEVMAPLMRSGQYKEAIDRGFAQAVALAAPDILNPFTNGEPFEPAARPVRKRFSLSNLIVFLFLLLLFISRLGGMNSFLGGRGARGRGFRRGGFYRHGGWGGGFGGGGGGGFGGGGGGGFSGGGSSGGW